MIRARNALTDAAAMEFLIGVSASALLGAFIREDRETVLMA
jgi:hypothetical protein